MAELLALASEEELGFASTTINGVEVEAVVTEISNDEVIAAGGTGEAGGFTAIVSLSAYPAGPPEKFLPITARGMSLYILTVTRGTAHYVITAGDPVTLD